MADYIQVELNTGKVFKPSTMAEAYSMMHTLAKRPEINRIRIVCNGEIVKNIVRK